MQRRQLNVLDDHCCYCSVQNQEFAEVVRNSEELAGVPIQSDDGFQFHEEWAEARTYS